MCNQRKCQSFKKLQNIHVWQPRFPSQPCEEYQQTHTAMVSVTYVKNGPVELSRSAAVKLNGALPSQSTGVADATAALATTDSNAENFIASRMNEESGRRNYSPALQIVPVAHYNWACGEKPRTIIGGHARRARQCELSVGVFS